MDPKTCKGKIQFKHVWFKYPTRKDYIFADVSFTINAGENVAFAGPSGMGKSTAVQLLLRFYDPQRGEILLDDVNIKDINLKSLRHIFGLVGQEPYLFNNSIKYNIMYNCYDTNMDQIREASTKSNAINFIEKDEEVEQVSDENAKDATGFNRPVGVKGGNLSGGQKQRVAIARAILREPTVFLYDEATSALDAHAETLVQEALNKLAEGKTTISIAHRISVIKDCDVIFVINKKKIAEQGTYHDLMAKKGLFWVINQEK